MMPKRPGIQGWGPNARAKSAGPTAADAARLLAEGVDRHRRGLLDQAAALYRRVLEASPEQADALHLLGRIAEARGDLAQALALIERAITANGRVSAFHASRGSVLLSLGRAEDAARSLRQALSLEPNSAEAHNVLGNAMLALGDATTAIECYQWALALRPQYPEARNNLGSALRAMGRLEEAEAELARAIALRPNYASALANLGLVLQERARYGEALEIYDRAIAADPAHAAARGNRAMLLLLLGSLREGFAEYEWRWRMPGFATPFREFPQPMWDGGDLAERTLFIHAEQGLGSAIQFVRYAALLAAEENRVIIECRLPLQRLFESSLAGPGGRVTVVRKGERLPPFDRHAPLMSLPHLLGTTMATIPAMVLYLSARSTDVAVWRERLGGSPWPRIGLVWAGNPRHENDHNRSMPASYLAPLVASARASFYSLQVPAAPQDLAALPPGRVNDLAPALGDFADTAAVIENLDLVVSVDTAVAHLTGALGKPVWLLLPYVPEWRWLLDREDSPWYPTMRLFRQQSAGDWAGVVERVKVALASWSADAEPPL
jgi:tetratricopeptide (TPR) repeat protein